MDLYSYYRSSAAYRVRIALNYKKLSYEYHAINLLKNGQFATAFTKVNPQARVPTLIDQGHAISQSLAILEYLEEQYPTPAILPVDKYQRAWVRELAQTIACDIHPLNNVSVLRYLLDDLHCAEAEKVQWMHHWLQVGFTAIEQKLMNSPVPGRLCLGDQVTLADICLIPQVYNAHRFELSMAAYPRIMQIYQYAQTLPAVQQASPEQQPDYLTRE